MSQVQLVLTVLVVFLDLVRTEQIFPTSLINISCCTIEYFFELIFLESFQISNRVNDICTDLLWQLLISVVIVEVISSESNIELI